MIYFCKGCDGVCKGCSKGCDECGKCCNEACGPCCKVLERPLGGYVLLTAIANFIVFGCAVVGGINKTVQDCKDNPVMLLCFANAAIAVIHICFGFYLQARLVSGLEKSGAVATSSKELLNQAGHIMLYDVGFCLYVFVFIGSFGLNCIGMSWISGCEPGTPLPYAASLILILFAVGIVFFAWFWWMILCCDDCCGNIFKGPTPVARPPPTSGGGGGRPPQQRKRSPGLFGCLLGGLMPQPQQQKMPGYQQPAQQVGVPVAAGYVVQPSGQTGYGGSPPPQQAAYGGAPPAAAYAAPAPAPQPQSKAQEVAGTVAAGGLSLAGKGLTAAGGWLQGKGQKK